jgi:uncharacterized protein (DUF2141 family)
MPVRPRSTGLSSMKSIALTLVLATLYLSPAAAQVTPNPIPSIAQPLVPSAVAPRGVNFTLTIHGTGFVANSLVLWNGEERATAFVSQTELQATILADDIKQATTGRITVQNPKPGGGLSPVAFLPVRDPAAQVNFALDPVKNSTTVFPQDDQLLTQAIDVNNDGILDLIWTPNSNNNTAAPAQQVNVQLGKNNGFQAPIATAAFPGVFVVGYGDFNGDGNVDLLVESGSDSQQIPHVLAIMLGNGDGTFQAPTQIADPATVPGGSRLVSQGYVAVADLNGDGKLDVVYAAAGVGITPAGVTVLFGNGDGTFTAGGQFAADTFASQVGLADLNHDGKLDLVVAGAQLFLGGPDTRSVVEVLLGNGDGTFGAEQIIPGTQKDTTGTAEPANFAVADFNGDGIPDLVYFSPGPAFFYPGNGDGTFGTPVATSASGSNAGSNAVTLLGDFNGDGKLDMLLPQENVLLLGNADGTFSVGFNTESLNSPSLVLAGVAGDFDDNGMIDAAGVINGSSGSVINILEQNTRFASITVSPNSLTFAPQQVGTESAPQLITVTNTGSAPWIGSAPTLPGVLRPSRSRAITARWLFHPEVPVNLSLPSFLKRMDR